MARLENLQAEIQELRTMRAAQSASSHNLDHRTTRGPHLDSIETAAGLMQLSSAAVITTTKSMDDEYHSNSVARPDVPLPPGWQRTIHDSGVPCYVHDKLGVVCWSKPYELDRMSSQEEFIRAVKIHAPPLSIFQTSDVKAKHKTNTSTLPPPSVGVLERSNMKENKKRKLEVAEQPRTVKLQNQGGAAESSSSMSMEEFRTLSIGDSRVLQACMELSVKTPAQVLQEYQNRNRGISINYNTIPTENNGVKLFKTIVTAGSTAAEGIASTKKIAKQLGAQKLLAILHERTASTYIQVADLYSSATKSAPGSMESPQATLRNDMYTRPMDPRFNRGGPNRSKKLRRFSPSRQPGEYSNGTEEPSTYAKYGNGPPQWNGYQQYGPSSSDAWGHTEQHGDQADMYSSGRERIVQYSSSQPGSDYGQYYGNNGDTWAYSNGTHSAQYGRTNYTMPTQARRQFPSDNYYPYRPQSSDRSAALERVKANMRSRSQGDH